MTGVRQYLRDFLFVLGDARRELPRILGLFMFAALLDLCGLGLILPLITAMTLGHGAEAVARLPVPASWQTLSLGWLAGGVAGVYIVRAVVAYWVQRSITQFSENQRGAVMTRLLHAYLLRPYEYHLQRNSAALINTTLNLSWGYASGVLNSLLRLVTDAATFCVILAFLAWAAPLVVLAVVGTLGLVLGLYNRIARTVVTRAGETVAVAQEHAVRTVNHSLGAIREMRILGVEQHAISEMKAYSERLATASAISGAVQVMPRYLVEASMIALLAGLAVLVERGQMNGAALIPTLGLFAVAAVRLMPGATAMLGSINILRSNSYALRQLAEDLRFHEGAPGDELAFGKGRAATPPHFESLVLEGVTYSYPNASAPAIKDISLTITAGQAIGIVGRSGSGKSTLADVILGLIRPQQGFVRVNGQDVHTDLRLWMSQLAYIPQSVFIKDDSLRANVAFGVSEAQVDEMRVKSAIAASQLEEVVRDLPQGMGTVLGERGVRLSGGQRQRVALARALYHDRDVIVMDEATAALDSETEREVIRAIQTLHGKKTLIVIAHRLSTLEGCDVVLRLDSGSAAQRGTYSDVVGRTALAQG